MFIVMGAHMGKLRKSEILSAESHHVPTELGWLGSCRYKHPAPTEPKRLNGCMAISPCYLQRWA